MLEDKLQSDCFKWHWNAYPGHRRLLFHVPNGGQRNAIEGAKLKAMGVVAGVADLLLIHKGRLYAIELKTETGVQSKAQKIWQSTVEAVGARYYIVCSLDEFKDVIEHIYKL